MTGRQAARACALILAAFLVAWAAVGCGGSDDPAAGGGDNDHGGGRPRAASRGGGPGGGGMPGGGWGNGESMAAVPVETTPVVRRPISSFIETNGTLEAENEVDVVARVSGPIVKLLAEEGDEVQQGQLLAQLDDEEYATQLEISRVGMNETRQAFERAQSLQGEQLISTGAYEQAVPAYGSAKARYEADSIQLGYTEIKAPFRGLIVTRYVDFAQQVSANTPLFRISDFDPLLCPIQVPERSLSDLRLGQSAYLTVEPYPGQRFDASVLRISPVVDAATGTIKVTLQVRGLGKLRPGMFTRVFVETATRPNALVIPKSALSLESIGDTVYVAQGETASRREVTLGFREGDYVEVLSGLAEDEQVVVVGQDALSDGTPIQVLASGGRGAAVRPAETAQAGPPGGGGPAAGGPPGRPGPGGPGGGPRFDLSKMTPEQLERAKEFMRARGMTDEQIEERIRRARQQSQAAGD